MASRVADAGSLDATLRELAANVARATGAEAAMVVPLESGPPWFRLTGTFGLPEGYGEALQAAIQAKAQSPAVTEPPSLMADSAALILRLGVTPQSLAPFSTTFIDRDVRRRLLSDPAYGPVHRFAREATWDTVVSVPMVYHERQVGVVIAYYRRGHDPGDRDVALLRAIADQAAVAVENARLLVEAQGRAALEERQRLARELHDSVSQAIYGIGLGARTARHLLDEDASRLDLRLHAAAGEVLLDICNEGVGFDPRASYPGHLGLRSMRERIARVGGRLAVESAPGRGTCVRAVVPLT